MPGGGGGQGARLSFPVETVADLETLEKAGQETLYISHCVWQPFFMTNSYRPLGRGRHMTSPSDCY